MKWRKNRGEFVYSSNAYRCAVWPMNDRWSCEVADRWMSVAKRSGFKSPLTAQDYASRVLRKHLNAELKRVRAELDGAS